MRKLGAFTLVEVIIVVVILAVLMGLLFPVLIKAKQQAYVTQDVQQMRQVYLATALYREDSNDAYPHSLLYTADYAKSKGIYVSPVDPFRDGIPGVKDFPADMYTGTGLRSPFRISYGYLYPMAIYCGESDAWFQSAVADPETGLISMKMYNDVSSDQFPSGGIDLWRWLWTAYRIRVDGSFTEYHHFDSVSNAGSVNFNFGPFPD